MEVNALAFSQKFINVAVFQYLWVLDMGWRPKVLTRIIKLKIFAPFPCSRRSRNQQHEIKFKNMKEIDALIINIL